MRLFFRLFLSMVFLPVVVFAAGGITMQYNADVANLRDGDVFYADRHYRAPLDTIKKTVNGLLGNSNIAADAKIAVTKLDSAGRLSMDSVIANKGIRTPGVIRCDSLAATKGVSGTYGRFSGALSGTTLTASSTATVDSLRSEKGVYVNGNIGVGIAPTSDLHISKSSSGSVSCFINNTSTTATSSADLTIKSWNSALGISTYPASYATSGVSVANGASITHNNSGGISIAGTNASGAIRFYTGGSADANERMRITADGAIRPAAIATPASPAASAMQMYFKGSRFILQYNDGGTVRWKYLDLAGTGVTWVHTTSAP